MKVITAVEEYTPDEHDICVFLAGGITNCGNWQNLVIDYLKKKSDTDNLVVFNPRRENFPIHDHNASTEQIAWEFKWLERMDIFSMYFAGGVSDQPICMYELGRNLARMQMRFPTDWERRIVISCESEYNRITDVIVQSKLASGTDLVHTNEVNKYCVLSHAEYIYQAYENLCTDNE